MPIVGGPNVSADDFVLVVRQRKAGGVPIFDFFNPSFNVRGSPVIFEGGFVHINLIKVERGSVFLVLVDVESETSRFFIDRSDCVTAQGLNEIGHMVVFDFYGCMNYEQTPVKGVVFHCGGTL